MFEQREQQGQGLEVQVTWCDFRGGGAAPGEVGEALVAPGRTSAL